MTKRRRKWKKIEMHCHFCLSCTFTACLLSAVLEFLADMFVRQDIMINALVEKLPQLHYFRMLGIESAGSKFSHRKNFR